MSPSPAPYILTLKLDRVAFELLNQWRQQYFPPARNFLPAHVTLFHALPGEQGGKIRQVLSPLCSDSSPLPLSCPTLRFLGRGVAVEVECPELVMLRRRLAAAWQPWLSNQDRQGYRPHVTIQNKVGPNEARHLYERLMTTWKPFSGWGEGLLLWRYLGGPWELVDEFHFQGRG